MCKKLFSIFLLIIFLSFAVNAFAQYRTGWEMNYGEGLVDFANPAPDHGDPIEFNDANIPAMDDINWVDNSDPENINFSEIPSSLCDVRDCLTAGQFTYFRTSVFIPADIEIDEFTVEAEVVIDGISVTIFNSANPETNGPAEVHIATISLGSGETGDLKEYIVKDEWNTVIITHVDDCCYTSFLNDVRIKLNGEVVTTCPPFTVITQDATVYLDSEGHAGISIEDVYVGTTSVCDIVSISVSPNSFTCSQLGENTVTVTATDVMGHSEYGTATVTVVDLIDPTVTCPEDITMDAPAGTCEASVTWDDPVYDDNCEVVDVESDFESGQTFQADCANDPEKGTEIVYTVTDQSGNSETCSFMVTVLDNEEPEISITGVEGNYEGLRLEGDYGYWDSNAEVFWNTDDIVISYEVTDNCDDDPNVTFTVAWEGEVQEGVGVLDPVAKTITIDPFLLVGELTVTVEATDYCGNSKDASTQFTIILKIPDGDMIVKPERLCRNPGKFTVITWFPCPFDVKTISEALCDGAPMLKLITCGWCMDHFCKWCERRQCDEDCEDEDGEEYCKCHVCNFCEHWRVKAILKFNREDILESLFDTNFVLRGMFEYNGKMVYFQGSDETRYECKKKCGKPWKTICPIFDPCPKYPWSSFYTPPFSSNGNHFGWNQHSSSYNSGWQFNWGNSWKQLPLFYND